MASLSEIVTIIPSSTASVERSFSTMNDICTTLRAKLGQQTLENLLRMCLEGPSEFSDSELDELVLKFKHKKERKIKL